MAPLIRMRHRSAAILLLTLLVAGCGSATTRSDEQPEQTTTSPPPMATPLIGSVLAEPVPVPATDGRTHLAYEVQLTNALGGNATLESLTVSTGDRDLLTLAGPNLRYWTRLLGDPTTPNNVLGPGQSALVWIDLAVDNGAVPGDLTHSVRLRVEKPIPGLVPADVTQDVAPVTVSSHQPVSITAPLDGPNWVDGDGCCDTTAHRLAVNPINGKLRLAERFALDYVQLNNEFRLFTGVPTKLESYAYFGAAVHAVGAGKVVSVVDDLPEQVPTKTPSGLPLDQHAGNHIVQDLGDGNYALYAYLEPGSITVNPGDELEAGQQIAALGNSGNSDAPRLHFRVMDGPDPLLANGLPFVIKDFRVDQRAASRDAMDAALTGQPVALQPGFAAHGANEVIPLGLDVMTYSVGQ